MSTDKARIETLDLIVHMLPNFTKFRTSSTISLQTTSLQIAIIVTSLMLFGYVCIVYFTNTFSIMFKCEIMFGKKLSNEDEHNACSLL